MRRIQYDQYGGPEMMYLDNFKLPTLKQGEVVVKVKASSINPIDWKIRQGNLKMMTGKIFPRPMGSDFSGVVDKVGPGVHQFKVGDEVFGISRLKESGSFAEYVVTSETYMGLKPTALSYEQAACIPTAAITAWNGLVEKGGIRSGQQVFVGGCMGSVGQAAVQLAHSLGAEVTGSCHASAVEKAQTMGLKSVHNYLDHNLSSFKGKFDIVFDTSGKMETKTANTLLKPGGVILDLHASPVKFLRSFLGNKLKLVFCTPSVQILNRIAQIAVEGNLQLPVGQTVSLEEAIPLITELERGKKLGGKGLILTEYGKSKG